MSKYRHEYKYFIDPMQEAILRVRAAAAMGRDPHVRGDGTYLIRSAYFDDPGDGCLLENLNGTDPRSKFRIRYYNDDADRIRLEKKSKLRGMCLKESCAITRDECEAFLMGEVPDFSQSADDLKKALFTEIRLRGLRPVAIVTYERRPFVYGGGNVRVTFDRNLTSSNQLGRFLSGDYARRPVFAHGRSLMEVKWDELLPGHIKDILQLETLQWTASSKYSMCRTIHM